MEQNHHERGEPYEGFIEYTADDGVKHRDPIMGGDFVMSFEITPEARETFRNAWEESRTHSAPFIAPSDETAALRAKVKQLQSILRNR